MTSDFSRVTVCVPVRNGAQTISRTLDSILTQDYPNFEVIVLDNCSTDETARIVRGYAARGVRYYSNPQLEAYGDGESNWNHILSLAAGPLIALYHADDIYTPTMVRKQADFLAANPETSAVFTMMQTIDEQDRPIRMGSMRLPKELQGRDRFDFSDYFNAVLKYCTFTPVPTMMTRRQVLDAVGVFNWQMFVSAADVDLYLRMARNWGPLGVIDEPLHKYRISSKQGSAQINRMRTEIGDFFRVLDDYLTRPEVSQIVHPDALAYYEMNRAVDSVFCAMNLLVQGNVMKAKMLLKEALQWRYFRTACRRPRRLARLMEGAGLLVMGSLGAGILAGRCSYWADQLFQQWRRKPAA